MTIFNMVGGGGGIIVPLDPISDLSATGASGQAMLQWTDPQDIIHSGISVVAWTNTVLVRKIGSTPQSIDDGTTVLTSTTRNQYSTVPYIDEGLTNGVTYYYVAFAVGDNGTIVASNSINVVPNDDYLCFTANRSGSTVTLSRKYKNPSTYISLETSRDKETWSAYTIGTAITLSNVGDKVYFRNTSETNVQINDSMDTGTGWYQFLMSGSISASGDVSYIMNKHGTKDITYSLCFAQLFKDCTALTTPPKMLFTTAKYYSFNYMFSGCTNLIALPKLYPTSIGEASFGYMFRDCSKIKISTTKTGDYQNEYRIPITGEGTTTSFSLYGMFLRTGGTFTGEPKVNTTYYTSNAVV